MTSRAFDVPALATRYLRLSPGAGTSAVTVSEVRAFCDPDAKVRRGLHVEGQNDPPPASGFLADAIGRFTHSPTVTPAEVSTAKLVIVLLALLAAFIPLRKRITTA